MIMVMPSVASARIDPQRQHLIAEIEMRGRLVEQNHVRFLHEGPRQQDQLALAAAQPCVGSISKGRMPTRSQRVVGKGAITRAWKPERPPDAEHGP